MPSLSIQAHRAGDQPGSYMQDARLTSFPSTRFTRRTSGSPSRCEPQSYAFGTCSRFALWTRALGLVLRASVTYLLVSRPLTVHMEPSTPSAGYSPGIESSGHIVLCMRLTLLRSLLWSLLFLRTESLNHLNHQLKHYVMAGPSPARRSLPSRSVADVVYHGIQQTPRSPRPYPLVLVTHRVPMITHRLRVSAQHKDSRVLWRSLDPISSR